MDELQAGGDAVKLTLHIDGKPVTLENVARGKGEISFVLNGRPYAFRGQALPGGGAILERQEAAGVWQRLNITSWQGRSNARHVQLQGLEAKITERVTASQAVAEAELSPRAPMPGLVRKILVAAGERVEKGQALAVMEAMKLQMTLYAGAAAVVEAIAVREGEMIAEGIELVRLKEIK